MTALEGVRIIDLTWGMAGPGGVLLLAEHGADVIKVEPPGGDPYRGMPGARVWNRSRRSVALDLKSPEGRDRFESLLAGADVLVESFSPGVMHRLGLDYDSLASRHPALVYCAVPAYPSDSRRAGRPGWDALVQARSGQQFEQQAWRPGPAFLPNALPSVAAMYLTPMAILAALHARSRTGRGQRVETSLYQGVLAFTTMLWVHTDLDHDEFQTMMAKTYPPGVHQPEVILCEDGWIQSLAGATQKRGASINAIFDLPPDLPPDAVYRAMAEIYRTRKREELLELLHGELFQTAEILPTREALAHPQVVFNGMAVPVDDPEVGPTTQVGMPFRLSRNPASRPSPRPLVGQHNEEVFAESPRAQPGPASGGFDHSAPLHGIRVLDFGRAFAGPFGPMLLAGLGADVIKVATPATDPGTERLARSTVLLGCEQGKRSLLVDLKTAEGLEIVHRLVATADIVHHNMVKGVAARLQIDYPTLSRIKPDLIYCNTYMYGPEGPLSHLGGNDSLSQALTGWEWDLGAADAGGTPLYHRFGHTDTTNAMASIVAVLLALAHRDRTGEGQEVWTSLLNAALYPLGAVHLREDGAEEPPRLDRAQTGLDALYRLYPTADGWIQLAAVSEQHWVRLCGAAGLSELAQDPRFATAQQRRAHREELEQLLGPVFAGRTALQWRRALDAAGVPAEVAVDTVEGDAVLFDDDNLRLGLVAEVEHATAGRLRQAGQLMRFSGTPSVIQRAAPVRGEHTLDVLEELGYDKAVIGTYLDCGIVATA